MKPFKWPSKITQGHWRCTNRHYRRPNEHKKATKSSSVRKGSGKFEHDSCCQKAK